jgi:hypothetical protein
MTRYYESEGRADPHRIEIAKGSYVPVLLEQPGSPRQDRRSLIGRGSSPFEFERATILAALTRHDAALDLLEKACENLSAAVLFTAVDYRLIELRSTERFQALLRRMWLVDDSTENAPSRALR